ncbi:MAG: phosphatidylglycerophosphatase A [Planctomycetota bacterium]
MPATPSSILWLTTFGLGNLRPAPGTWGSLPPINIAAFIIAINLGPGTEASWLYYGSMVIVTLLFSGACVVFGDVGEAYFGKKDHGSIVADETAGQAVTLLFITPAMLATPALAAFSLAFAFFAFRILDIVKPWPADAMQSLPGGWGVLLDDILAGVLAGLVLLATFSLAT